MSKTTSDSTSGTSKKVWVTLNKLGSDEQFTFEDGDSVEHMIQAVGATEDLTLTIAGKDPREFAKGTTVGQVADAAGRGRSSAAPLPVGSASRKGSHG